MGAVEQMREDASGWVGLVEGLLEQLESALRVVEAAQIAYDGFGEDDHRFYGSQKRLAAALDAWRGVSTPAKRPFDPKFPNHSEGCICPRFDDIAPDLIADLTCPVHGVNGTDPGDKLSKSTAEGGK
jgi:hypothetical protein